MSQTNGLTNILEDIWGNILNNDIDKVEIAPRKAWITLFKNIEQRGNASVKGLISNRQDELTEPKKYTVYGMRKYWNFRGKGGMISGIALQ